MIRVYQFLSFFARDNFPAFLWHTFFSFSQAKGNKGNEVAFLQDQAIHVHSEIGQLKKVMLHRPGKELENLMPEYLDRLLFDDIP